MKRKLMIIGCMAMILSIAFLLIRGGSARTARALEPAPAEVTDLKDLAQLKEPFQRDRDTVRLIALLSPVCPACRSGFSDMQKTLKGPGIQLLLAAHPFFACRRNSGKFGLLCKAPAIPASRLGSVYRIRLLSILASQAVQMPAEFAERDSSLVFSDCSPAFYSVPAGDRKSSREHIRRLI